MANRGIIGQLLRALLLNFGSVLLVRKVLLLVPNLSSEVGWKNLIELLDVTRVRLLHIFYHSIHYLLLQLNLGITRFHLPVSSQFDVQDTLR